MKVTITMSQTELVALVTEKIKRDFGASVTGVTVRLQVQNRGVFVDADANERDVRAIVEEIHP